MNNCPNNRDDFNPYTILNVSKTATSEEIKRSYKKLILVHHPDKGGNVESFINVKNAYDILSDENKRQQYDLTDNIFSKIIKKYANINDNDYKKILRNKIHNEAFNLLQKKFSIAPLINKIMSFNFLNIEITILISMTDYYNNKYKLVDYERVTRGNFTKKIHPITKLNNNNKKFIFYSEGEKSDNEVGDFIVNIEFYDLKTEKLEYFIINNDIYVTVRLNENSDEDNKFNFVFLDNCNYEFLKSDVDENGIVKEIKDKGLLFFNNDIGDFIRGSLFVLAI